MKLPPDIQFHEDIGLLVFRPRGLLNEAMVNKIITVIGELEHKLREPFNRFSDTLGHDEVELNFRYVFHVSLYRRLTCTGRPPIKSAILATDSTIIHYGRLHGLLTQGSPIKVRIFQERNDAAQWLGAPIDLLTAEPERAKHPDDQKDQPKKGAP